MQGYARCTVCLVVLTALLVAVPSVSGAQTTVYPLVVSSQGGLEKSAAVMQSAAHSAIEGQVGFSTGGADGIMHSIPATAHDFEAEAQALFAEAQAKYEEFEFETAVTNLEQALELLENGVAYLEDLTLATNVLYYLGVIYMFNMEDKKSNEAFLRAYVLAPDSEPDPNIFNPEMIQMFKDATQQVYSLGTGSLGVTSEPSSAHVYLDGRYMGLTPVNIDNVVSGKHMVRIVRPGYQFWGTITTVKTGQTQKVNGKLFPAVDAAKINTMADGLPALLSKGVEVANPSLKGITVQLGVDQLLLIWITSVDSSSVSATWMLYDSAKGAMIAQRQGDSLPLQEGALSMKSDELTRNTLIAGQQADTMGGTGEVTIIGPPVTGGGEGGTGGGSGGGEGGTGGGEPGKDSIVKKWWFWVALVGGVAVVGGATTAGVCLGTDACKGGGPGGPGGSGDLILEF